MSTKRGGEYQAWGAVSTERGGRAEYQELSAVGQSVIGATNWTWIWSGACES